MSQHLYISPAMQVSFWPVVIIPQAELWANKFFIQNPTSGKKFFWQNPCPRDINLKENLWFFDKICSQMLNNFTAFDTVFYNFHAALFSLINDLLSLIL